MKKRINIQLFLRYKKRGENIPNFIFEIRPQHEVNEATTMKTIIKQ
jgi:hypothetical protein